MAGDTISAFDGTYTLILYKVGNCFTDNVSEIVTELPEYDIHTITDDQISELFKTAYNQYSAMKTLMESDEL